MPKCFIGWFSKWVCNPPRMGILLLLWFMVKGKDQTGLAVCSCLWLAGQGLHIDVWLSQQHVLKEYYFPHCIEWCLYHKLSDHTLTHLILNSILFHWSEYLSYTTNLLPNKYCFTIDLDIYRGYLSLLFKITLIILCPLYFHMNFKEMTC